MVASSMERFTIYSSQAVVCHLLTLKEQIKAVHRTVADDTFCDISTLVFILGKK